MANELQALLAQLQTTRILEAVDDHLEGWLPARVPHPSVKVVKDRVWGLIELPAWIIPFVDSRLLQRQRRIRQLGLSDLVFPGAGYSRFEHALGCFHTMSLLLKAVQNNSGDNVQLRLVDKNKLLLAALLHDVGHLPFSHATERVLESRAADCRVGPLTLKAVRRIFRIALNNREVPPAEILSALAVLSTPMQALVRQTFPDDDASTFVSDVASIILGIPPSPELRGWAQLVSGPCDADKLDYMARDALVSGVPVSVDVPRLLARCRIERVDSNLHLPPAQARMMTDGTLFLTTQSGNNALEEMTISRFILYDRVYNHHKARAAESLLDNLLHLGLKSGELSADLLDIWLMTDESLLCAAHRGVATKRVAERLLYRELPHRALVYSDRLFELPVMPMEEEAYEKTCGSLKSARGALVATIDDCFGDPEQREAFIEKVRARAKEFAALLSEPPDGEPDITVWLRPGLPFGKTEDALVKNVDGNVEEFRVFMPVSEWGQAYSLNKRFGYVFCEPPWRPCVHLAAEYEFWLLSSGTSVPVQNGMKAQVRLKLSATAASHAKLATNHLDGMRKVFDEKGTYAAARPLRPLVIDDERLARIAKRFRLFEGVAEWKVTSRSVGAFVRQFPVALQDDLCSELEALRVMDRSSLSACLEKVCEYAASLPGSAGSIFAASPNSGNFVRWLLEQNGKSMLPNGWDFAKTSLSGLGPTTTHVVLVDDLVSSGSQTTVQLQAWMGVPREEWLDPDEQNIDSTPLPENIRDLLRKNPVTYLFAFGDSGAPTRIETVAKALGLSQLSVRVIASLDTMPSEAPAALIKYLREVGEALLGGKSTAKADALGYGGRTGWITGVFNVPTCCPPALWMPGTFNNHAWVPLLIRRGYQGKVVFV